MNKDMENTFNRMAELGGSDERLGTNNTPVINAPLLPKNTRPAPAATDTGLVTVATVWPEGELVTRSQAEAIIRDLETKILEAAISDRLDDAGAPLSWQERAEIAEGIISDLKADNAAKDARIKELEELLAKFADKGTLQALKDANDRAEALEAKLEAAEKALEPFANAADGRKSKSVTGSVCFSQHYLLAARAVLGGKL